MAMKFKNIRAYLNENNIPYFETENGQHLIIQACSFDSKEHSNFFDYEEPYKAPNCYTKDKILKELFNDPRIIIQTCDVCCGCAGW